MWRRGKIEPTMMHFRVEGLGPIFKNPTPAPNIRSFHCGTRNTLEFFDTIYKDSGCFDMKGEGIDYCTLNPKP